MSGNQSLAQTLIGFTGNTLVTVGTAATAIGVMYGINKITGHGISVINSFPKWLGMTKVVDEDAQPVITKQQVGQELTTYAKIILVVSAGVVIKYGGNKLNSEETLKTIHSLLLTTGNSQ